jgi:hypothetical protein
MPSPLLTTAMFESTLFPLPITNQTRATAQAFAQAQPNPVKAQQVKLNTLAVCTVCDYLTLMGIPFDLTASYSWNPVTRLMADTADLVIPGVGRVECRPLLQEAADLNAETTCLVPPEVQGDRLGYIVVQIGSDFESANLVGYCPAPAEEDCENPDFNPALNPLHITQLQPIDALLDYLDAFELAAAPVLLEDGLELSFEESLEEGLAEALEPAAAPSRPGLTALNRLGQWLNERVDEAIIQGWEQFESFQLQPAYAFRGASLRDAITRGQSQRIKLVRLHSLSGEAVDLGLMIALKAIPETQKLDILVQLHQFTDQMSLPTQVELAILDDTQQVFREVQAGREDKLIQLNLRGMPDEQFSVRVRLGETSVVETFVI